MGTATVSRARRPIGRTARRTVLVISKLRRSVRSKVRPATAFALDLWGALAAEAAGAALALWGTRTVADA